MAARFKLSSYPKLALMGHGWMWYYTDENISLAALREWTGIEFEARGQETLSFF